MAHPAYTAAAVAPCHDLRRQTQPSSNTPQIIAGQHDILPPAAAVAAARTGKTELCIPFQQRHGIGTGKIYLSAQVNGFVSHLASKVEPLEAVVNELVRAIKARHVARLQAGSCSIEYGFVLDDLLTNYERVCDHCSNVAVAQIEVAQDSFDTHAYLNDLRHGNDTKESEEFHRRLGRYRERYLFPDGQTAEEN